MTSSDNPIHNTIKDILGLGRPAQSFSEKIDRLRGILSNTQIDYTGANYAQVLRASQGMTSVEGYQKFSTAGEKNSLIKKLIDTGVLPHSASELPSAKGVFYYNESNKSLRYGAGSRIGSLPTALDNDVIFFNDKTRMSRGLTTSFLDGGSEYIKGIDAFYRGINQHFATSGRLLESVNVAKRHVISLLQAGVTTRGNLFPEKGNWVGNTYLSLDALREGEAINLSLRNFQSANTALTVLTRRGFLTRELVDLTGARTVQEGIAGIQGIKDKYYRDLSNYLESYGALNSYPYIKPEGLGRSGNIILGGSYFTKLYGSNFEARAAEKGLFQLAHLADTTGSQMRAARAAGVSPYAAFLVEGQSRSDLYRKNRMLKVAVVDSPTAFDAERVFGDSGSFLTDVGRKTLTYRPTTGSMSMVGPSDDLIGAVERVFGVNLADGMAQSGINQKIMFNKKDFIAAIRKTKSKRFKTTDLQKDLRTVINAFGKKKFRGFFEQLSEGGSVLNKIELSDTGLRLDFLSSTSRTTESVSTVVSGVRTTSTGIGEGHVFHGQNFGNAQMVMSADDLFKTHGPHAFLSNFVGFANEEEGAAEIFRRVFGMEAEGSKLNGRMYYTPRMRDVDTGFAQLNAALENGTISPELANKVRHGLEVGAVQMGKGVQGTVRMFYLTGSVRIDQGMDINMFNPVRITPSKMRTMARGSAMLGYKTPMENPMFAIFANMHSSWRSGLIRVSQSGHVKLSNRHSMREVARALMGRADLSGRTVATIGKGGFYVGGTKLSPLPADPSLFGTLSGGIHESDLAGSILDPSVMKGKVSYIDLGKERTVTLFGKQRTLRYLPVPTDLLRMRAINGRVSIDKSHPSYGFIKELANMQGNLNFGSDAALRSNFESAYEGMLRSIPGSKGLLAKKSTILAKHATRVRLSPHFSEFFTAEDLLDPEKLFHGYISRSSFDDYISRKGFRMSSKQVDAIYDSIARKGYFYAMVGVDPMQRSEHMTLRKIFVKGGVGKNARNGIMNLALNPLSFSFMERDLDMDPANMIPVTGSTAAHKTEAQTLEALDELYARQVKKMTPFLWFRNWELRNKTSKLAGNRFVEMLKNGFAVLRDSIKTYAGIEKSYGYSLTRAAESVMDIVSVYGLRGANSIGLLDKGISSELIERAINPFLKSPEKLSLAQQFLQNVYQGPVQKGTSKSEVEALGEYFIGIGDKYKNKNFNYDEVVKEAEEKIATFLRSGKGNRAFMGIDYLANQNPELKASLEAMKADLMRGATEMAIERHAETHEKLIQFMSRNIAEYMVPGVIFSRTAGKIKDITNLLQSQVSDSTDILEDIVEPLAGARESTASSGLDTPKGKTVIDRTVKKAPKGKLTKVKAFLRKNNNKLWAGMGIGAVAGATIVSLMNGPVSMPRDVNSAQPTDYGPEVMERPPKLYGTNQVFNASTKRSPETFTPVSRYGFNQMSQSTMTIRDKRAPNNPYLLEQQVRKTVNSDYNY
jgi:hypothetical protein